MTSFIDLMADDVWSEADIKARLHAEIRSEISEYAETELNRALQGMALGMHVLNPAEQFSLYKFKQCTDRVAALGNTSRTEMALLSEAMSLESAIRAYTFDKPFQELLDGFTLASQDLAGIRARVSLEPPVEPVVEPEVVPE